MRQRREIGSECEGSGWCVGRGVLVVDLCWVGTSERMSVQVLSSAQTIALRSATVLVGRQRVTMADRRCAGCGAVQLGEMRSLESH